MTVRPPASVGQSATDIDTPALVVDLDALEFNIELMASKVSLAGRNLRAHAKAHKCGEIAVMQLAKGAIGLCCQKVSEAEALAASGAKDILITNEVIAPSKLERLATLARIATIGVCVDSLLGVEAVSGAARRRGVVVRAYVEVDVGQGRCGVRPDATAAQLAHAVIESPNLVFGGLQAYHGKAQHYRTRRERQEASAAVAGAIGQVVEHLRMAGITCPTVTGGGTGTLESDLTAGGLTEIQAGSYVFMDADYGRNLEMTEAGYSFRQSLFVKAAVISNPATDRVVIDAGLKAVSIDSGMPLLRDAPEVEYGRGGDEHGILRAPDIGTRFELNQSVWLIPSHCDTTVNLFDWIVGVRNATVEGVWQIVGRGAVT